MGLAWFWPFPLEDSFIWDVLGKGHQIAEAFKPRNPTDVAMLSLPSWLLTSRTFNTCANTIVTEPELSLLIFSGTPEVFHVRASSYSAAVKNV